MWDKIAILMFFFLERRCSLFNYMIFHAWHICHCHYAPLTKPLSGMPWVTSAMKRVGLVVFFHALAIFLPKRSDLLAKQLMSKETGKSHRNRVLCHLPVHIKTTNTCVLINKKDPFLVNIKHFWPPARSLRTCFSLGRTKQVETSMAAVKFLDFYDLNGHVHIIILYNNPHMST